MTNTDDVMTDDQLAAAINRVVAELNALLSVAGSRGLRVEIKETGPELRTWNDAIIERTYIKVKVWKPL